MIPRVIVVLLCAFLVCATVQAQPGRRSRDVKAQTLDLLFPLKVEPEPYFSKMVLRFGDSLSQLAVVVYFGGKSEIIRHRLVGISRTEFNEVTFKAFLDSSLTAQQIAAKTKVEVTRAAIDYDKTLGPALEDLKRVRLSPFLGSRVGLDDVSEFEFWYDTWEESVHYSLVGPFNGAPEDEVTKWMLNFRTKAEGWLKGK